MAEEYEWVRDARMCAVCHRVLDARQPFEDIEQLKGNDPSRETVYQHAGADLDADHEPDPIPVDGRVKIRCDFCTAEVPQWACWTVPVGSFVQMQLNGDTYVSNGDFAADGECAELIVNGRWAALTTRAAGAAEQRLNERLDPVVRLFLEKHTLAVRDNMKGPPYLESEL